MARPPRWTPEQLEIAMAAYVRGDSMASIEATGVPWATVHRYRRARGIPARPIGRENRCRFSTKFDPRSGYIRTYAPDRPYRGTRSHTTLEHIRVMELHLGRAIDYRKEVVHHIDHDKTNNDLSNLRVMSRSEHTRGHRLGLI